MSEREPGTELTLSIAAVERDTGIGKDTLRVWERRYGFPSPVRDGQGERAYSIDQVEKLRVVKRLLDAGHRPGRVVPLPLDQLQQLAARVAAPAAARGVDVFVLAPDDLRAHLALIRSHDVTGLKAAMTRILSRVGVARFVTEIVGPLNGAVGDAWLRGQLHVFEEHLYSEAMQAVLRAAVAGIPPPAAAVAPRVLLTTFPGEPHGLGLLMLEAMLALEGCRCLNLGPQTPLTEIVLAAEATQADVVALSFTGCLNPNQIHDGLQELRSQLAPPTRLWAGGSAPVLQRRPVAGVEVFSSMAAVPRALRPAQPVAMAAD